MSKWHWVRLAAAGAVGSCLGEVVRPANVGTPVARIAIVWQDSGVLAGHTLPLGIQAWDGEGNPIDSPLVFWTSADSLALSVNYRSGLISAPPGSAGDYAVTVSALSTGAADTLVVHVARPGEVRWRVSLGRSPLLGGPALGPNGTVYVLGNMHVNEDTATLYAIGSRGAVEWSRRLTNVNASNYVVVGQDGTVYVVGQYVWVFFADGTLRWALTSRPLEDPPLTAEAHAAALSTSGALYATMGLDLFALDAATGDTLWQGPRATDGGWLLPPSISADGKSVYVKNTRDSLYAFRANDGQTRWALEDSSNELSYAVGPTVAGNRLIIPLASHLQEADSTGAFRGLSGDLGLGVSEPAIAPNGDAYVQVPQSNGVKAFGPGATLLWETLGYRSRWTWYGGPALAEGGVLYAASIDGFYALQLTGSGVTVRWRYPAIPAQRLVFVGAPLIGPDGTVYTFTSCDLGRETLPCSDELIAFWEDKPVEPNSPWPMWRHDARRSGQADR